jgi:hypothetical protein
LLLLAWDVLADPLVNAKGGASDAMQRQADTELGPTRVAWRPWVISTLALWAISLATITVKVAGSPPSPLVEPAAISLERGALMASVYWLNLKSLVWPLELGFGYAPVTPHGWLDPHVVLGILAIAATGFLLWSLRGQKLIRFGVLWFLIAVAPSSQLVAHHVHRADRFLYLPLVGLALIVAFTASLVLHRWQRPAARTGLLATGCALTLVLAFHSARLVFSWQNDITVWENAVRVDPANSAAHCALADQLALRQQYDTALETYRQALLRHPDDARLLANLAWLLATCEDAGIRDPGAAIELAQRSCVAANWQDPAFIYTLATCHLESEQQHLGDGQSAAALSDRRAAVDLFLRMATLLTMPERPDLYDPEQAIEWAERACAAMPPTAERLAKLARVYAVAKRNEMAIDTTLRAIQAADEVENKALAAELRNQLVRYRSAEWQGS